MNDMAAAARKGESGTAAAQGRAYSQRYARIEQQREQASAASEQQAVEQNMKRIKSMKQASKRRWKQMQAKREKLKREEEERRQRVLAERKSRLREQIQTLHQATRNRTRRPSSRSSTRSARSTSSASRTQLQHQEQQHSHHGYGHQQHGKQQPHRGHWSRRERGEDGVSQADAILEQALKVVRQYQEQQQQPSHQLRQYLENPAVAHHQHGQGQRPHSRHQHQLRLERDHGARDGMGANGYGEEQGEEEEEEAEEGHGQAHDRVHANTSGAPGDGPRTQSIQRAARDRQINGSTEASTFDDPSHRGAHNDRHQHQPPTALGTRTHAVWGGHGDDAGACTDDSLEEAGDETPVSPTSEANWANEQHPQAKQRRHAPVPPSGSPPPQNTHHRRHSHTQQRPYRRVPPPPVMMRRESQPFHERMRAESARQLASSGTGAFGEHVADGNRAHDDEREVGAGAEGDWRAGAQCASNRGHSDAQHPQGEQVSPEQHSESMGSRAHPRSNKQHQHQREHQHQHQHHSSSTVGPYKPARIAPTLREEDVAREPQARAQGGHSTQMSTGPKEDVGGGSGHTRSRAAGGDAGAGAGVDAGTHTEMGRRVYHYRQLPHQHEPLHQQERPGHGHRHDRHFQQQHGYNDGHHEQHGREAAAAQGRRAPPASAAGRSGSGREETVVQYKMPRRDGQQPTTAARDRWQGRRLQLKTASGGTRGSLSQHMSGHEHLTRAKIQAPSVQRAHARMQQQLQGQQQAVMGNEGGQGQSSQRIWHAWPQSGQDGQAPQQQEGNRGRGPRARLPASKHAGALLDSMQLFLELEEELGDGVTASDTTARHAGRGGHRRTTQDMQARSRAAGVDQSVDNAIGELEVLERDLLSNLEQLDRRLNTIEEKRRGPSEERGGDGAVRGEWQQGAGKARGARRWRVSSAPVHRTAAAAAAEQHQPKPPRMPRTQSARIRSKQWAEATKKEVAGGDDAANAMAVANARPKKQRSFRRYHRPSSYAEIHG